MYTVMSAPLLFPRFSGLIRDCAKRAERSELECSDCVEEALLRSMRTRGYADFDKLVVEALVEGIIVNEGPLHIGAGREESPEAMADIVLLRVKRIVNNNIVEVPTIPGSSLKGVLRSQVEAYAATRGFFEPVVRIGGKELVCTGEGLSNVESWLRNELCKRGVPDNELDELFEKCLGSPVIGVFGAPWLASHVQIFDAYPEDTRPPVKAVAHVSIDRFTGSQAPGLLYTMEHVEPGVNWRFRMLFYNLTPESKERWELVRYMFTMLEHGVLLGRRTSTGMGLVKLYPDKTSVHLLWVDREGVKKKELSLKEWLDGGWWQLHSSGQA